MMIDFIIISLYKNPFGQCEITAAAAPTMAPAIVILFIFIGPGDIRSFIKETFPFALRSPFEENNNTNDMNAVEPVVSDRDTIIGDARMK